MTVLFFSRLFWPHVGGVERHVLEVGKELVARGHTVTVVAERHSKDLPMKDYFGEIQIYRISIGSDSWFKKFRIWLWLLRHKELIAEADVIHCHDVFFWFLPLRFLFPKKPVYTTFHGYEGKFPPSQNAILVRRLSAYWSKGNICVGDYIEKWYWTKSSYVTYGAVRLGHRAKSEERTRTVNEKIKILLIGRLEKDTGITTYLNAIKRLKRKKVRFKLEVCGDGPLREKVEKFGKVYGFVEDLGPFLEHADIVFTSSYLSILEALAYKKVVIAVYENPLKEDYLAMAPFANTIVITPSPKEISEHVVRLTQNVKARDWLTNKGYHWVSDQSWEKVTDMYEALWRKQLVKE